MRSSALAIAWEFRQRHRWGLLALGAYLLALAIAKIFFLDWQRVHFRDEVSFAFVVMVPIAATFLYFLATFTFGLSGDIAARQSMFPPRRFALPITTNALVAWPMILGAAAIAVLWLATRLLAAWPADVEVPVFWPALLAASLLAWTQALTWMAYPLPGMRVVVIAIWLAIIDAIVMVALHFNAREAVMLAILAPHVPLAYFVARFAVSRARRGDVPDWRAIPMAIARVARIETRLRPFPSPARAQMWFEWREHGRSLPWLVALLLPFELWMFFAFRETPVIVYEILILVLFTPPLLAIFVAATVSKSGASDSYGVSPLIATRPLTNSSLIAAKLNVTVLSTVVAWLLVLIALPLALRLSGAWSIVAERGERVAEVMGTPRAIGILVLGLALLMASTWKQLVQSLFIGMSGREWLAKGSLFGTLFILAILFPLGHLTFSRADWIARLWLAFPWILAALVAVKISLAVWVAKRLRESGVVSDRILVAGAALWCALVFALYVSLAWIGSSLLFRTYFLALVAILLVPLARLSAAPLALEWNRHR